MKKLELAWKKSRWVNGVDQYELRLPDTILSYKIEYKRYNKRRFELLMTKYNNEVLAHVEYFPDNLESEDESDLIVIKEDRQAFLKLREFMEAPGLRPRDRNGLDILLEALEFDL